MSEIQPYVPTSPGDLITADLFNGVQVKTKQDIAKQIADAIKAHQDVEHAKNADKLEGKNAQQLSDDILERALQALPGRTGYKVVYKRLQPDEPAIIEHKLGSFPLVDLYELQRFLVVASADGKAWVDKVHWFIYHRSEMRIRKPEGAPAGTPDLVLIEESRGPVFKHTFQSLLDLYDVDYDDQSTLGDVVNEFWKKLFSDPNDVFDETSYANSPWLDRCCGDRRTVESLKRGRDWDDIYVKVVPRKTVNSLAPVWPLGVEVLQFDLNTVGLLRADFARLTMDALGNAFDMGDGGEAGGQGPVVVGPVVKGPIIRQPIDVKLGATVREAIDTKAAAVAEADAAPETERLAATRDQVTVEELVRFGSRNAAEAAEQRGHPEPDELFLMVLLKV